MGPEHSRNLCIQRKSLSHFPRGYLLISPKNPTLTSNSRYGSAHPDREPPPGASLPFTMPVGRGPLGMGLGSNKGLLPSPAFTFVNIACPGSLSSPSMFFTPFLQGTCLPTAMHLSFLLIPLPWPLPSSGNVELFCFFFFFISEFLNSHPHMLGLVTDHLSTIPCCCFYPRMYW